MYFWPGSEAKIGGYKPSVFKKYNQSVPFAERVETAVSWFKEEGKDFVALYFHEPDSTGHKHGPNSTQVAAKVGLSSQVKSSQVDLFSQTLLGY